MFLSTFPIFKKLPLFLCFIFIIQVPAAGLSRVLFPIAARGFFCLLSTLIKLIHSFIHYCDWMTSHLAFPCEAGAVTVFLG